MKKFLLTAINIPTNNLEYKIVKAETETGATEKLEKWCADIIEKHNLVVFKDKKVVEITNNMEIVKFVKTNGFQPDKKIIANIKEWEKSLFNIFKNEIMIIEHFYYGNHLDMADVILKDGNYMQYNIREKNIRCSGHVCTHEQKTKFDSLEK